LKSEKARLPGIIIIAKWFVLKGSGYDKFAGYFFKGKLKFNFRSLIMEKVRSQGAADKFIRNEFEQLSATKLPQRGEVQGCTS
jgi:hypothetical protein